MAEPIRRGPLSNEIPRRNPSADNAIGTEDGDIGGNKLEDTRIKVGRKGKKGARFVRSAYTRKPNKFRRDDQESILL